MAVQVRDEGRYLGGRPPYGYRLADAGPHPNKAHAAWGRRARRLEPDPETAHIVRWIFARRLAGSFGGADRAGAERGRGAVPVGGRPGRNPHRTGRWMDARARSPRSWPTRGTRAGRCGTGSGPTRDLADPARRAPRAQERAAVEPARRLGDLEPARAPGAGQRGGLRRCPGHQRRPRPGPRTTEPVLRRYLLAGLLACGAVRAADGISLVQRQARVPVPARPHQRDGAGPGPAEEHLRPRGQAAAAPARPAPAAYQPGRAEPGAAPGPAPMSGAHASPGEVIGYRCLACTWLSGQVRAPLLLRWPIRPSRLEAPAGY